MTMDAASPEPDGALRAATASLLARASTVEPAPADVQRASLPAAGQPEDLRSSPYVCERSDSIFTAIEKCLDNGLGSCVVVEPDGRVAGRVCLDDIRASILDGRASEDPTLRRQLAAYPSAEVTLRNDVAADDCLRAVVDRRGHLTGVKVDRSQQRVQVGKPDLSHHEFRTVLDAFLSSCISNEGPYVTDFEKGFSAYVGCAHGIAVSNGTVALHLALAALGVGPGDEVIVPDLTFAATINAVIHCGARPVIVDVDPDTWNMTLGSVKAASTARTKAVIIVHLYGRPAEAGAIARFARGRGIAVVEDCAEAPGAECGGKRVGTFGDISCFSFYANKIVTTGEGGMCLTDCPQLAETLRTLSNNVAPPDRPDRPPARIGFSYRLTNIQAAIGHAQLKRIDETLKRNARIEKLYKRALRSIAGVEFAPALSPKYQPVVWLTAVLVPAGVRDSIVAAGKAQGVEMRPFFHPLSSLPPYAGYAEHCPNSIRLAAMGLNLPTSRDVDEEIVRRVAGVFRAFLS